ncbi:hypothetical protein BCD67_07355 [Oscillatoriales cyanobacterium USR001]|nr:hypothetical protein BCD67_07355 [Oscillatoriales cyanobacterium USR001]
MQNYTFEIKKVQTVACKLEVSADEASDISAMLKALASVCNYIHKIVPPEITNSERIKQLIDKTVREDFGLPSSLAICAIEQVAENRQIAQKTGRLVKEFKSNTAECNSGMFLFRQQDLTIVLTLLEGEKPFKILIGKHQLKLLKGQQIKSATLVKRKDNSYYIHLHWEVLWKP